MTQWSKVTNPTLSQRNTLQFVKVIYFMPDLVEADKLDENLLGLLDSVEVGLCIVLYLVDLFCDCLLQFSLLVLLFAVLFALFFFLFDLILDLLQIVIDVLRMMKFLRFKISFEHRYL